MIALGICREVAAQDIEVLVMPGQVVEGHADIEEDCTSCHKFFDKSGQRQLCMDCHEDVAIDINTNIGFHGRNAEASNDQCRNCHTDHLGREAQIAILDESAFDHGFTDFELLQSHLDIECVDCHVANEKHRDAGEICADCHTEDNVHGDTLGTDCASCHQSTVWPDGEFDHETTDYPLVGKHQEVLCLDCHDDHTFPNPPTNCYGCHAEDDSHNGRSGTECERCHNPLDWNDASFDHQQDTDFPLEGKHAELVCDDCHSEDPFDDELKATCVSCHLEDDQHAGNNGDQCDSCHTSSDWAVSLFDHDRDTDYALLGAHKEIVCADCHVEPVYEVQLGTTCDSCHLEDDVHESALGTQCESCHTEVNWQDPVFFDHDLTRFPLLGSHSEPECEACHATQVFVGEESDCVACHLDDDVHRGNLHERCDDCHNPVAWNLSQFDHNAATEFPLEGKHIDVDCESCHRAPLDVIKSYDGSCGNCHRSDDVHDGEFGSDCARCHSADSFSEVKSL